MKLLISGTFLLSGAAFVSANAFAMERAGVAIGIAPSDPDLIDSTYDPSIDAGLDLLAEAPDAPGTTSKEAPVSLKGKYAYLGASYYGVKGCQAVGAYYGFQNVGYWGPYALPPYYQPGYFHLGAWIPAHWVPAHTVTYCYGIKG